MGWFQTETAETLKTHLFNVMLVFSGSLRPPVSPLSKRNEKEKTRNSALRWRKTIALMHKSYYLRSKHPRHQPRGKKLELENQKWRTGSRPRFLSWVNTHCFFFFYGAFRSTNNEHLISSGLKQGHLRSIYLQSDLKLWSCNNQGCMIQSSCGLCDSRVPTERFSKPLRVREFSEGPNEVLKRSPSHQKTNYQRPL